MNHIDMLHNKYTLSIRIGSDGFFLSILDETGEPLLRRDIVASVFSLSPEDIVDLLTKESAVTGSDYAEIRLTVESNFSVIVPDAIFKPQEMDHYFYFQHKKNKNDIILFNRIESWEVVNIFSIPLALHQALTELFPDVRIIHQLSYLLSNKIKSKSDKMYIWVRPKAFDVILIQNETLTLINTFSYTATEDIVYYILSIFDRLRIDMENTVVELYQHEKASELQEYISRYVKHCETVEQ